MRGGSGFIFGVIVTLAVLIGGGWLYLRYGHPPVATADKPFPLEAKIAHTVLNSRIARDNPQPPFQPDENVMLEGAHVYAQECADCHGLPGKPSQMAKGMFPVPPQLWERHGSGVVGVSDDPVGHSYWLVHNGVRLSGMPSYTGMYSEHQQWAVSWLVSKADQPMSPAVQAVLAGGER